MNGAVRANRPQVSSSGSSFGGWAAPASPTSTRGMTSSTLGTMPRQVSLGKFLTMTTTSPAPTAPSAMARPVVRCGVVVVASFLLGGLTSYAQGGLLPDAFSSFANSASGWTVLTALLVYWSRARTGPAAVLGAVSFVLLVLGYTVAADVRGFFYDPLIWSVVGVVVGPFVGIGTSWLRATGVRAALGTALFAGIGIGECVYGLTVVGETTSPVYWVVIGAISLALLVGMLVRRIQGVLPIVLASGGTAVITLAYLFAGPVVTWAYHLRS